MPTETQPPVKPAEATPPVSNFLRERLGIKAKDKTEEKPADGDKPADKPVEKKVVKPAKKKPAAKAAEVVAPVIDTDAVRNAVAEGVREGNKKAEPVAADTTSSLTDAEKKRLRVLEHMAKTNPASKDLPKQYLDGIKKLSDYKEKWLAENKGKKFDIADEEHADFISGNNVTWDEDEYVEALADIKANEAASKSSEKFGGEISELKRNELARTEAPIIGGHQRTTAKVLFNQMGADFEKVIREDGTIDNSEIGRMIETNPIYEKVFPLAEKVERVAGEIMRIARGHTAISDANPIHREIVDFATRQEKMLASLPEDQRVNERGQMFVTSDEFARLTPKQRESKWTLNDKDLSALYAFDVAQIAKKIIEDDEKHFAKLTEKRGYSKADAANGDEHKLAAASEKPTPTPPARSPAPLGTAPRMAPVSKSAVGEKKPLLSRLTGGR